jgi:hypothetical protein
MARELTKTPSIFHHLWAHGAPKSNDLTTFFPQGDFNDRLA